MKNKHNPKNNRTDCENDYTEAIVNKMSVSEMEKQKEKDEEELKRSDKTPLIKAVLILSAILSISISFIISICFKECSLARLFADILEGTAISCIAGLIITHAIDLRSKLKEYETSFLNALSSNNYVRQLSRGQLQQLRLDVTKALHYNNSPNISDGLIHLDNDICELLEKVYCIKYRQTTICSNDPDHNGMVRKKNNVEYVLVNPRMDEMDELIAFHNLYKKCKEDDKVDAYFLDFDISLFTKDNDKEEYKKIGEQDKQEFGLIEGQKPNPDKEFYNASVYYGRKKTGEEGRWVKFKSKLKVCISFTIITPADDICFTKRVKHPTCNFRLDYFYDSNDVRLYGQLFGTNIEQSEVSVVNISDNKISLETSEWLLPKDGAIVVATRKKE